MAAPLCMAAWGVGVAGVVLCGTAAGDEVHGCAWDVKVRPGQGVDGRVRLRAKLVCAVQRVAGIAGQGILFMNSCTSQPCGSNSRAAELHALQLLSYPMRIGLWIVAAAGAQVPGHWTRPWALPWLSRAAAPAAQTSSAASPRPYNPASAKPVRAQRRVACLRSNDRAGLRSNWGAQVIRSKTVGLWCQLCQQAVCG